MCQEVGANKNSIEFRINRLAFKFQLYHESLVFLVSGDMIVVSGEFAIFVCICKL